ncbi:MAG: hypothetical protein M3R59_05715 [Verrucomicrobiota bacterium]|nr:hypothetical protein [Verrucomicrobiota bacterium]
MKSRSLQIFGILLSVGAISARAGDLNRASKILTAEAAQTILGAPVEADSRNADADTEMGKTWVSKASYSVKSGGASGIRVSILIRHAPSHEEAQSIFESSKATFHGEDVAGLGDAAYRTKTPAQLNILKGNDWLIITAGTFRDPDPAMQEKLAREILAKMPAS